MMPWTRLGQDPNTNGLLCNKNGLCSFRITGNQLFVNDKKEKKKKEKVRPSSELNEQIITTPFKIS